MSLQNPRFLAGLGLTGLAILIFALLALSPWSSSTAQALKQGDANCDQSVDAQDALAVLHLAADTEPGPACGAAGDVDCSGDVNTVDALDIIMFTADVPTLVFSGISAQENACPPIGSAISTPTSSATPTPTHTVTAIPTQTPTVTPSFTPAATPTATPAPGAYRLSQVLSANYLGDAVQPAIEFVPIPGSPNEALVALQTGYIYRVFLDQSQPPTLWGDVHNLVKYDQGEQGLLAVAFSPSFVQDHRVYMYYSQFYTQTPIPPTVLARFSATATDLTQSSKEELIHVQEIYPNHNGGQIAFDNAGMLYFSVGDGGSGGDPDRRAQSPDTLLGKISRIDVSGQTGYTIPGDNPYAGHTLCSQPRYYPQATPQPGDSTEPCPEIFALGFRNPFRFSYDSTSDQIWAGDVGQADWEEIDHVTLGGNYGWSCKEGNATYNEDQCDSKTFVAPRTVYDHKDGNQAVTGGVIYRGSAMPELYGWYVYADFYSGNIWALNPADNSSPIELISHSGASIAEFVSAPNGEIWMMTYNDGVYQLARP